ncbi:5-methylcytosine restriction system specificity protein McrC [Gelidibacter pelagius]|uniref:Restriction endonuclease n=1 Tax=Gelidibacter pelagius TaxID=2819985 RepID=A0ABS3SM88_9FLAO|nr:restriction endonuclease [Gelidibacter pelagius]MBO3096827.1 restriction endonuclease [Gelidibacter pelagius]
MQDWLFNILHNNTLVDNQRYEVLDAIFTNQRLFKPIRLNKKSRGQWTNKWNNEDSIWQFLNTVNSEVNSAIKGNKETSIILFNNKEYEHNTDDDFINVQGININQFTLTTGNLIGFVKQGDNSLKISSRFGDSFLRQIISDADGFVEADNLGGTSGYEGFEWLLVYLWKTKLKKAFRLGLPKQYINKKSRLNKVKGQLDSLDYYMSRDGKYLCNYREHSYNNRAAQLILEVFNQKKGSPFLEDLNSVKNAFVSATEGKRSTLRDLINTPYFSNPFYSDYNDVIDLSKLLIKQQSTEFGNAENNNAFFFDVSMLFEYFIRKLLIRKKFHVNSKFDKRLQIPTGNIDFKRKLEPDIIIDSDKGRFVFDVKYKSFDFRYGANREDLFQLHTYVGQFGNKQKIGGCGFIYPILEDRLKTADSVITEYMSVMGKEIPFYVIFLVIPPSEKDYSILFKRSSSSFIDQMSKIIF